jgi:hypothetical protein
MTVAIFRTINKYKKEVFTAALVVRGLELYKRSVKYASS